ncbi:MAG: MBOAT family protein [Clostridiales bacterium]|nr:MBOAT family protein [Candidatus Blautia equi]
MSLVSNLFVLFVVLTLVIYYIVPKKLQWMVLLFFSYLYYIAGGAKYVFFILFSTIVTYVFALLIQNAHDSENRKKYAKLLLIIGLCCNLGMLGVVKYANFFIENINLLFKANIPGLSILFPLGISFFTFQSSGYLIDVYWKRVKAEKNPFRYALFVSFFPQLLQGPIGRYQPLADQLYVPHAFSFLTISRGAERILWGFCKKMILADWAGCFADAIWGNMDKYNGIMFFGLIFYGIQLYADFSGGMDVVIGIAEMFGITLEENFRRPYFAVSMADFWKRWHMTLGEWMMNYVFYPVSLSKWMVKFGKWSKQKWGRKQGRVVPIALADLIVFFLVGIWHGASWKYVAYGLLNGVIIAFSELMVNQYRNWRTKLNIKGTEKWFVIFAVVRTYIIVNLRWFFDRSDTLTDAFYMIKQAFTHFDPSQLMLISAGRGGTAFVPWALLIIAVGCVIMVTVGYFQEKGYKIRESLEKLPLPVTVGIYILLLVAIGMFGSTATPKGFIYAQF